jgi:hypothetical protein
MTVLNRAWSATAVAAGAAADINAERRSGWDVVARRLRQSLLVALLIASTTAVFASSVLANGNWTGAMSTGSSRRMVGEPMSGGPRRVGSVHARSFASLHRFHFRRQDIETERARAFRRFHHGDRDELAGGFFPFGFFPAFGWPDLQPDSAIADDGGEADWGTPLFWRPVERYEPPTVEKSPSGVIIIRGPGSHHVWP